ncbi:8784_t:CDS:2, partial [Cetraspora pellucida]
KCQDVVNELVRVLKPGGFLELCEPSSAFNAGPVTKRLWDCECEALKEQGCDFDLYQYIEGYCQNQGQLKNIKKEIRHCCYNDAKLGKA